MEAKMTKEINYSPEKMRRLLSSAAQRAAKEQGYELSRMPGRGLASVWAMKKGDQSKLAAIRTTRDRWYAFEPIENGAKWKTLNDVELVVVAAVDSDKHPQNIEVYFFDAAEVRDRFNAAYAARIAAGHVVNYGMWVSLDLDERESASSVGSGIVDQHPPVAVYSIEAMLAEAPQPSLEGAHDDAPEELAKNKAPATIAEVMTWARERVAVIAGVSVDAVKLELKVEY